MRPTTKNLLLAPLGDFPFVRRILPILRERIAASEDEQATERLVAIIEYTLLRTNDKIDDSTFVDYAVDYYYNWQHEPMIRLRQEVDSSMCLQRSKWKIPLHGSTSDESRAYWKERTYGLTDAQKTNEASTAWSPASSTMASPFYV